MFKKHEFKNGLRLITIPLKNTQVATLLVLFKAGSRYESDDIAGISHFCEHIFFKGSKKRPTAQKISSAIDGVGGEMNAFTSKEFTGYYIKIAKDYLGLAVDVLADMLKNPVFKPQEIEKEKGVIVQEINMYEDIPLQYVGEIFEQVLYPDQNLGREVIGFRNSVMNLNRDKVHEYLKSLYSNKNAIVVLSGAIGGEREIKNLIEKNFHFSHEPVDFKFQKLIENQVEPAMRIKKQKTEQTHLCLGVRGLGVNDPKKYILKMIAVVLGGGMSSRLYEEIRDKRGLAYYVKCSTQNFNETGHLFIQMGLEHNRVAEAIQVVLKEMKTLKNTRVGLKELKKAKEYFKGNITLDIEDSYNLAQLIGLQELLQDKTRTPQEIFKEIEKVTPDQIQGTSQELFNNNNLNMALIGPMKNEAEIRKEFKI